MRQASPASTALLVLMARPVLLVRRVRWARPAARRVLPALSALPVLRVLSALPVLRALPGPRARPALLLL